MQAFIMTNGMRQTQQDNCMLIILYHFAHRLFILFLSEPRATKTKAPAEWTLDQAWCYSIATHKTIRNEGFILMWADPPFGSKAAFLMMAVPWECGCRGSRCCCPSSSLPTLAEQPVALPPQHQRSLPGCWWIIPAAEQGNSCRQGHLNHNSKSHHKAFQTFFTPGPLLF